MTAPAESRLPPPARRRRFPAAPLALAAGAVAGGAYLAVADPSGGGRYPPCPFHAATGWWCPGCGSTRAAHALLHGDVAAAVGSNVLVVLALPLAIWALAAWGSRHTARDPVPAVPSPGPAVSIVVLLALVAFGVARNLSATPFAALAP